MRISHPALAGMFLAVTGLFAGCAMPPPPPDYIQAAVSDPTRPEADTKRDADRKPAQMLGFAQVKPGAVIADLIPGRGYFTRLFSKVAGPQGKVYAFIPTELDEIYKKNNIPISTAIDPAYANVRVLHQPISTLTLPEKADLIWTSQNYHDMKDKFMGPVDMVRYNKAVFNALKSGGFYIVLDHSALAGAPENVTETLHRIDEATVKKEVLAAGFVLADENNSLRNPDDPRTKNVFDPSIRGKTDQFVLKFRKP